MTKKERSMTEVRLLRKDRAIEPTNGSAGLLTQMPGQATTVTAAAEATGGIGAGNFIQ